MAKEKYFSKEIEKKWRDVWEKEQTYKTDDTKEKKTYALAMFPYPSGAGLHVGHVRIYTGTDILARFFRMKGYGVLNPMGWDAFGLPAENAAIKAKKNPMDMVPHNIANFKRQMQTLGFSFDWSREFATTDPDYYKWTQWLFLKLYSIKNKQGERLIYKKEAPINWCPSCKTGLANEEVLPDGTHERCGNKTVEKLLPQWMMRITDYADRLLLDLDSVEWVDEQGKKRKGLDWPNGILEMQKNWIGKKEGIEIDYKVEMIDEKITCFTTRPDTNFGATFIVLAPEHPFVQKLENEKVKEYVLKTKAISQEDRIKEGAKKTGVFTGYYAVNNLNGKKLPIWVSDFVLAGFGTGAVVGVPGHDRRDFEFAQFAGLPVERVVVGSDGDVSEITTISQVQENDGTMINSQFLDGLDIHVATQKMMDYLVEKGWGKRVTTYHLRDWIFSRQRYWGEPFPLIYCDKCGDENGVVPVPEESLPVTLPYVSSYEPTDTGESPLSQVAEWVHVKCPVCGGEAKRETDTMPNWAGSCWYFLYFAREVDLQTGSVSSFPQASLAAPVGGLPDSTPVSQVENKKNLVRSNKKVNIKNFELQIKNSSESWLPVSWYLGGAEHAVLHLLYARFWTKAFADLGLLNFQEPFLRLRNVGMVLAADNRKMSKSLGNVVNPDDVVEEFGADTLRIYEAFMAPFNAEVAWSTRAVQGAYRFISRIWQIYHNPDKLTKGYEKESKNVVLKLQSTISKISSDISNVKFNTSVASMMELLNEWEKENATLSEPNAKKFLQLLAPFAPYISEELWHSVLGERSSIHLSQWPMASEESEVDLPVNIPVQVNGRVREVLIISPKASKEEVLKEALLSEKVTKWIEGRKYETIFVPGKILNIVTS